MVIKTDSGICINGFKAAGIRKGKYGLALIVADKICESAGVFTKNNVSAAHIPVTKKAIENGLRAIVINSGNANACVKNGISYAKRMCEIAAKIFGINSKNIGVASTGIIGKKMDMDLVEELIKKASLSLGDSKSSGIKAARAIMTTDTYEKYFSAEYKGIEIGGIAKGAGMIAPNMATMLCFLTTNADFDRRILQQSLEKSVEKSFNMISVDNCMSTNDTVLLISNRKKKCKIEYFQYLLDYVTTELAKKIARDGEGAKKFIEVVVKNSKDEKSAREGAMAIVSSSLVKTAIHGENPNWGRITAALGSVVKFDFNKTDIFFESNKKRATVVKHGNVGNLEKARKILKNREIRIIVDLKQGKKTATSFGCDLSPEYVRINAEYN